MHGEWRYLTLLNSTSLNTTVNLQYSTFLVKLNRMFSIHICVCTGCRYVYMQMVFSTRGSSNEDNHTALLLYANMPANFGSICNPIAHQLAGRWFPIKMWSHDEDQKNKKSIVES
ncbi:hypothetical protein ACB092_03G009500 [Castanea dentata]